VVVKIPAEWTAAKQQKIKYDKMNAMKSAMQTHGNEVETTTKPKCNEIRMRHKIPMPMQQDSHGGKNHSNVKNR
jgi:hypothetical protein